MSSNDVYTDRQERSLVSLLSELTRELTDLMRQEVQLAKAEFSEKVSQVGSGVGSLAVGGAIVFAGFLVLLNAVVIGLHQIMGPTAAAYPWLSPLIVGLVVLLIGFVLLQKGRSNLKATHLAPHKTSESLLRDKELLKEQIR